jgi:CRP/FNR family transcriptional regulator, cyclic AMP receptor protein
MISQVSTDKLHLFFSSYRILKYKKKDMILRANDTSSSVFLIQSGYIRVYRISEQGEELTLTILRPGDFFPLTYSLNSSPNPYYLEAITPLEFWRAPQERFMEFIRNNVDVYFELTNKIMVRMDGVLSRMEYLIFSNAYTKIAATLLACANKFGDPRGEDIVLKVPLTHKDIATLVGITRETTSLEIKKLEHDGFIGKEGKLLVVKNYKKLERDVLFMSGDDNSLTSSL